MAKKSKKTPVPPPIQQTRNFFKIKKSLFYSGLIFLIVIFLIAGLRIYLQDIYYPQIFIAQTPISFQTKESAKNLLYQQILTKLSSKIIFKNPETNQVFELDLSSQINNINFDKALDEAYLYGHNKPFLKPVNINLEATFDQNLENQLATISKTIDQEPIDSQLKIEGDQINVTPSQTGALIDKLTTKQVLLNYINNQNSSTLFDLPIKTAEPKLSYENGLEIKKRLDQIKLSPLKLKFNSQTFDLNLATILELIDLENTQSTLISLTPPNSPSFTLKSATIGSSELSDTKLTLNQKKVSDYLQKNISPQIDRPVEEPLFNFEIGQNKVTAFKPPVDGQKLDLEKSSEKITQALLTPNQTSVELVVQITQPKNILVNDLGIKEQVGQGYSTFSGSIENRIFNVSHGASKIHGILIPPGEIFSFNKTVGDITAATGFKQAYVIKSGRTVLDDGGGICQVSTTLFRAALNAGLPIIQRTAHAYRVSYYEQGFPPGLDATIFYPSVDFQFKNDTPNHLLIQTKVVGTSLTISLYGTSDDRQVTLSRPVITSQTPAPPELRQDDPTLPKGVVKQVDWAAAGANVTFNRKVTRNGQEIINETFRSNYRPWQAVFLVGTKEG